MQVPIKFTVKANYVGNSLKITIPQEVAEYLSIGKGTEVQIYEEAGRIIIEKKK